MAIRLRLREAREARGLTQVQLAEAAGVRQATISELERAPVTRIRADTLDRLARALGVAPGLLLDSAPEETPN